MTYRVTESGPILSYFRTPPRLIFEIGRREGSPKVSSTSLKIGHVQSEDVICGVAVKGVETSVGESMLMRTGLVDDESIF